MGELIKCQRRPLGVVRMPDLYHHCGRLYGHQNSLKRLPHSATYGIALKYRLDTIPLVTIPAKKYDSTPAVVLVREIEIRYANGAGSPTLFSAMQTFDIVTGSCISGFDFGHCTHNIFSFLVILCLSSIHYETPYMI